jgi:MFS family permease
MRRALLGLTAALALADASVVTLALPPVLRDLETTVQGVAAVIGVYTAVLALALPGAAWAVRTWRPGHVAAGGGMVLALASLACAGANTLPALLVARGGQALGAAALLAGAFVLLDAPLAGRRTWTGIAVFGTAAGPALGGAITQVFDWRAIFFLQVPVALAAAVSAARLAVPAGALEAAARERLPLRRAGALALLAAALTAVLFLLVLLLVTGWGLHPLGAALAVSVLPVVAVLAHAAAPTGARWRAPVGCALVAGGTLALAFLPEARAVWTVAPQALAGAGMGLALPSLAGDDGPVALSIRHAGISLALLALAPVIASDLDNAERRATLRGVALVLDSQLSPVEKLRSAPSFARGIDPEAPRAALRETLQQREAEVSDADRAALENLSRRADAVLVRAVAEAFQHAFEIASALALVAGALAFGGGLALLGVVLALVAGIALTGAYRHERDRLRPPAPAIADPCKPRNIPGGGGVEGFVQRQALQLLDRAACSFGAPREELVLALADDAERKRFERVYGKDPRDVPTLLRAFF